MELCQQFRATADRPARPHASAPSAAAPENKAAPPRQKQGAPKPHHHFTTMDTSMTFDNAAPCATRCNFCSQCVHYRTNVRIQRRRERQARDRQRGIAPPPPPEPAPSPAKRARTSSQEPFVDVLLAAARDPLAVPQSAPARLATPFFSDAAMAPPCSCSILIGQIQTGSCWLAAVRFPFPFHPIPSSQSTTGFQFSVSPLAIAASLVL